MKLSYDLPDISVCKTNLLAPEEGLFCKPKYRANI